MNLDAALSTYRGELVAAAERWQKARARRRRRIMLSTGALTAAALIVGTAIAATGWLVGAPAPPSVKSDFGSYAPQLGFSPQPGKAVLVASNGDYQLFATTNKQGGYCILVSAPWKRPGPHGEGGDCSSRKQVSVPFWAAIGGAAGSPDGSTTTLVIDGRTTKAKAASVRFATPYQETVSTPVGSSGFFIVGVTTKASWCQIGRWNPRVAILDRNGHELATETATIGRGMVCMSKPTPTVTSEHGHKVFTIRATSHNLPSGYISGARLGDRITCRAPGGSATLRVPIHRAHTDRETGKGGRSIQLQVRRGRDGRVFVVCS
jgi:hypothetical protein